jgi:tocopherol cyclase
VLERCLSIWRPAAFHGIRRGIGWFEGWFFKLADRSGSAVLALIPGVFYGHRPEDSHAFIQVLDGRSHRTSYHRFPLVSFRASRRRLDVSIGPNRFTPEALEVDLVSDGPSGAGRLAGRVSFGPFRPWPVTLFSPGVMGPFSFVPFMECYHGVLSMDHRLTGRLETDRGILDFEDGRGYAEKDWGRSFPSDYVWIQSNHFQDPGAALFLSVARIPWLGGWFPGFLAGFLLNGKWRRFSTYGRGRLLACNVEGRTVSVSIGNGRTRLDVEAVRTGKGLLSAPDGSSMRTRVAESLGSSVSVRLTGMRDGAVEFEGIANPAALETHGNPGALVGRGARRAGTTTGPE